MENEIIKGRVIKSNTDIMLFAGSKLMLTDENGVAHEYILGSDIALMPDNDMRLFEVE